MSKRYLGGVITKSPVTPNVSSANGIWTMEQQSHYRYSNCWPRSPGAPAITSVTKGNANVAVAFSAPSCTGSNTLTSYIATSNTGVSATNSTSPITVTGLTNGSSYTFVVRGINSAGTGACSAKSAVAIPSTVPNAPTIGTATGSGCTAAVVTFTGSTCSGGNTITGYTVTSTPGSYTNTGASSPITVSGLNSNCSYTFKVKAQNANGYSACSSASNSVTFSTVPGAPTGVSASATSTSAISVSFSAPACTGHLTIDSYQVVCTSSGSNSATGSSSPISVTGLSAGTSYTFKVRAHNSQGYGSYSSSTGTATTSAVRGSQSYTSTGSYTWVAPTGVTSTSIVVVGAPNANYYAGALTYKNNYTVVPTSSYPVKVASGGCLSYFVNSSTLYASCGSTRSGCGGGNGGISGHNFCGASIGFGGGGAGGYSGTGGRGYGPSGAATSGSGGGGGGGGGSTSYSAGCCCGTYVVHSNYGAGGGGGVGIFGQGTNGSPGCNGNGNATGGSGGSGGATGGSASNQNSGAGGNYGGARGILTGMVVPAEGSAAVRIVWPGNTRTFPSTCVGSP